MDAPRLRAGRFFARLAAIALVGLAARLVYAYHANTALTELGDADWYHAMANQLADHLTYNKPFAQLLPAIRLADPAHAPATAWHPPLFPLTLALFSKLGLSSFRDHQVISAAIGAGGIALLGVLGRRIGGAAVGLTAAALAAVSLPLIANDSLLLSEALYAPLVTLVLLLALRATEEPSRTRLVALGAASALATLTRAEGVVVIALAVVCVALLVPRARAARAAVVLAAALVVLAPWVVRNLATFESPVYVSTGYGPVVLGANCPSTYYRTFTGFWDGRCVARQEGAGGLVLASPGVPDEGRQTSAWLTIGERYATAHTDRWPVVVAARVLRSWQLWNPSQEEGLNVFLHAHIGSLEHPATIEYFALALLAIAGLASLRGRRREFVVLAIPLVAVTLISAVSFGETRFRAGAEPVLCLLAAVALVSLWRRFLGRRDHEAGERHRDERQRG